MTVNLLLYSVSKTNTLDFDHTTLANVDRCTKLFHYQIRNFVHTQYQDSSLRLNCVSI